MARLNLHTMMILAAITALPGCSDDETGSKDPVTTGTAPTTPTVDAPQATSLQEQSAKPVSPFEPAAEPPFTDSQAASQSISTAPGGSAGEQQDNSASYPETYQSVNNDGSSAPEPAVQIYGGVGNLTWTPARTTTAYDNLQLKLSGPEDVSINRSFGAGESAMVTDSLPDGYYKWEVVTTPSIPPHVREQMRAARESGNIEAERALQKRLESEGYLPTREQARKNVQTGGFRIVNGQIMEASGSEE